MGEVLLQDAGMPLTVLHMRIKGQWVDWVATWLDQSCIAACVCFYAHCVKPRGQPMYGLPQKVRDGMLGFCQRPVTKRVCCCMGLGYASHQLRGMGMSELPSCIRCLSCSRASRGVQLYANVCAGLALQATKFEVTVASYRFLQSKSHFPHRFRRHDWQARLPDVHPETIAASAIDV